MPMKRMLGLQGSQRRSMLLAVTNQTEQQPEGALGQGEIITVLMSANLATCQQCC